MAAAYASAPPASAATSTTLMLPQLAGELTMTDLFCGGGGSTTGAHQIPGVRTVLAANHWQLAVDSHAANHADTEHDIADLSQVEPSRYRRTNLLWASPECTSHSQARAHRKRAERLGLPDEAAERSRATMWDVPRFTEVHHYDAVIVENVVDAAAHWRPFPAWLMAMTTLGYEHQIVWLNSMHAHAAGDGAAQSRDRMYVVFWRSGAAVPDLARWTSPSAWCDSCEVEVRAVQSFKRADRPAWGRYRAQYLYRCPNSPCGQVVEPYALGAHSIIDWTLPGTRIADRATPLADRTMTRIEAGLRRHGPVPLTVPVEGRDGVRARSAWTPLRTQTARNETAVVLPPGFVMRNNGSRGDGSEHCTSLTEPVRTMTTAGHQSVITWEPGPEIPAAIDCRFRMFEPHEVAAAMAFPDDYVLLGTKRERVRLAGNAVTPPAARDLVAAVAESLAGARPVAA